MKIPRIADAIGHIDDELITGADCRRKDKNIRSKWGAVAACFALLLIAGAAILPSLIGRDTAPGENEGRYKDYNINAAETAIIWPCEYQPVYEKYRSVLIDGAEYLGTGRAVKEALVGESIGSYTFVGYDDINDGKEYTAEFEVYSLQNVAQGRFIAAKMEGGYYVFAGSEYAPPSTLGELMEEVNLPEVVTLSRFSENGSNPDSKHFTLSSDDYIWEVLADCKDAAFVEDNSWMAQDREYLSFTVTSEPLGVYKVALYITEDGYLWTNMFSYSYLFDIGEEAAGRIIGYAKENSAEAEYEAYRSSIAGTIVEITEEYILVDDSILCKNPADGITYRVLLNDLRISRYVDSGIVGVGDTVQISYEGEIDTTDANTIASAISAYPATVYEGDLVVPE